MVDRSLEHTGGEFFENEIAVPTRETVEKYNEHQDKLKKEKEEREKEQAQEDWLSPENPAIWVGEYE